MSLCEIKRFLFLFHRRYRCQALFNVGCCLPKKLHTFIAGITIARARTADAATRFAFRTRRLTAIITRRCLLRTVSISRWWSSGPLHVLRVNSPARRNTAVEFSINNVTGKLRRKTRGCAVTRAVRATSRTWGYANSHSTFTSRAHNLCLCPPEIRDCASETRVNVASICNWREKSILRIEKYFLLDHSDQIFYTEKDTLLLYLDNKIIAFIFVQ